MNSSNGKWCVTKLPLNGASLSPNAEHPMLEFVVHNGQGEYDKPQTGAVATSYDSKHAAAQILACHVKKIITHGSSVTQWQQSTY